MLERPGYVTCYCWGRTDAANINSQSFEIAAVQTSGSAQADDQLIRVDFSGKEGDYLFTYSLNRDFLVNSYSARFLLEGWEWIKYVAVGYVDKNVFKHVKIHNIRQGNWLDFTVSHHDLAFLLQNEWRKEAAKKVDSLRLFIKGRPGERAALSLSGIQVGLRRDFSFDDVLGGAVLDKDLSKFIFGYWQNCYSKWKVLVQRYESEGVLPIYGDKALSWGALQERPEDLVQVNSYRFSWHALHSVSMLLLAGHVNKSMANVCSARELTGQWLDRSFYNIDKDQKYAWYDHGVAERTLVFIELWQVGLQYNFDYRFMSRLGYALVKHSELLESETFYSRHQPYRYHNHAWFQDIALIAAGICLKHLNVANRWIARGLERLHDQLTHLIHRESTYAIFVENSIGYHQGVQRLVGFAGQLESLAGRGSGISNIADELDAWSKDFRYPDGRYPAQGDTFRRANPASLQALEQPESWPKQVIKLPQAGYAVIKGGSIRTPWMFGLLATNRNSTHKHEDDLSFFLWLDGVEWLVDPSFVSHEYKDEIPAYLRSAKAHNMLHVEGAEYSYQPDPDRVVMNITEASDEGLSLSIEGHNRSCSGYEVARRLVCTEALELPQIICTDSFWELPAANEGRAPEKEPVGILTFHFGDGVRINSTKKQGAQTLLELSHPASDRRLILGIGGECDSVNWETSVEASVCGLGFMEHIETQALRIRVPTATECHWFIDVK